MYKFTVLAALLAGLLSACGYQLRGSGAKFTTPIYLEVADSDFAAQLAAELQQNGVQLLQAAEQTASALKVAAVQSNIQTLHQSASGDVKNLRISSELQLCQAARCVARTLSVQQNFVVNTQAALARDSQLKVLQQQLRRELGAAIYAALAQLEAQLQAIEDAS